MQLWPVPVSCDITLGAGAGLEPATSGLSAQQEQLEREPSRRLCGRVHRRRCRAWRLTPGPCRTSAVVARPTRPGPVRPGPARLGVRGPSDLPSRRQSTHSRSSLVDQLPAAAILKRLWAVPGPSQPDGGPTRPARLMGKIAGQSRCGEQAQSRSRPLNAMSGMTTLLGRARGRPEHSSALLRTPRKRPRADLASRATTRTTRVFLRSHCGRGREPVRALINDQDLDLHGGAEGSQTPDPHTARPMWGSAVIRCRTSREVRAGVPSCTDCAGRERTSHNCAQN